MNRHLFSAVSVLVVVGFVVGLLASAAQNPSPTPKQPTVHFVYLDKEKIGINIDHIKLFNDGVVKNTTNVVYIDGTISQYPISFESFQKKIAQLDLK